MKIKSLLIFCTFQKLAENLFNKAMLSHVTSCGISFRKSYSDTPHQNGVAELSLPMLVFHSKCGLMQHFLLCISTFFLRSDPFYDLKCALEFFDYFEQNVVGKGQDVCPPAAFGQLKIEASKDIVKRSLSASTLKGNTRLTPR